MWFNYRLFRHPYPPFNIHYRYRFHAPHHETYEVSWVSFTTEKLENYNWNYLDHYICTRGDTDFALVEVNLLYIDKLVESGSSISFQCWIKKSKWNKFWLGTQILEIQNVFAPFAQHGNEKNSRRLAKMWYIQSSQFLWAVPIDGRISTVYRGMAQQNTTAQPQQKLGNKSSAKENVFLLNLLSQ